MRLAIASIAVVRVSAGSVMTAVAEFEREDTGKHRQAAKDDPLDLRQLAMAPVERRSQRLVSGERRAPPLHQELHAISDLAGEPRDPIRRDLARRDLDRQRNAVEPAADIAYQRGGVIVENEPVEAFVRPVGKQLDRRKIHSFRGLQPGRFDGKAERR